MLLIGKEIYEWNKVIDFYGLFKLTKIKLIGDQKRPRKRMSNGTCCLMQIKFLVCPFFWFLVQIQWNRFHFRPLSFGHRKQVLFWCKHIFNIVVLFVSFRAKECLNNWSNTLFRQMEQYFSCFYRCLYNLKSRSKGCFMCVITSRWPDLYFISENFCRW